MDNKYNPSEFESKWKNKWDENGIYKTPENVSKENKSYILDMYPYPSGSGLHVGHPHGYLGTDVVARFERMQGKEVLHPIGFDAFGLPAENYAIKTGVHPQETTDNAIKTFKDQIENIGLSYDWSRELASHDPKYYKWTQWIFLQFYKKGLAYRKKAPVNWCPHDQTVLANEQVLADGTCERCGSVVVQKDMEQWFYKMTLYADRMLEGLKRLDWPESTKLGQINWIGKSVGAIAKFKISRSNLDRNQNLSNDIDEKYIDVYTTYPHTLFGATFVVLAPEHKLLQELKSEITNWNEVENYIKETTKKTELDRQTEKEKSGVLVEGLKAVNPLNNESVPIFIADYVLGTYGTGAIMACPAHDERDFEFAEKYNLPVKQVIAKKLDHYVSFLMGASKITDEDLTALNVEILKKDDESRELKIPKTSLEQYISLIEAKLDKGFWNDIVGEEVIFIFKDKDGNVKKMSLEEENKEIVAHMCSEFNGDSLEKTLNIWKYLADNPLYRDYIIHDELGITVNSGKFSGLTSEDAKEQMIKELESLEMGYAKTNYKLRDWLLSRQRYWGCPIPVVYDPEGNPHPLEESDLPLLLPTDVDFLPTGESPIARSESFKKQAEEKYGKGWHYEADTMDTFVDSSWYFFRFTDPHNETEFASKAAMKEWMPVDLYVGGAEHTVLHLLYARFFTMAFHDLGFIDFDEPFLKLRHQGTVLATDGRKMSKRWGNTLDPNEEIKKYGADTLRMYEMFMGPFEATMPWNTKTEVGVYRFLGKIWSYQDRVDQSFESIDQEKEINRLIKKVEFDIRNMSFNTAVAKMMEFINFLGKEEKINKSVWERFLLVLAPYAPFITEELWSRLDNEFSIHKQKWPRYDSTKINDETIRIAVQVNGKVRDTIEIDMDSEQDAVLEKAMESEKIKKYVNGTPKKVIFVKNRILNIIA